MTIRQLHLDDNQRAELLWHRDHAAKPYIREKCSALLKVADGIPAAVVARERLLKEHDPDVVYGWLKRYEQAGLSGLYIQPGRGRKAAFSPSVYQTGGGKRRTLDGVAS